MRSSNYIGDSDVVSSDTKSSVPTDPFGDEPELLFYNYVNFNYIDFIFIQLCYYEYVDLDCIFFIKFNIILIIDF